MSILLQPRALRLLWQVLLPCVCLASAQAFDLNKAESGVFRIVNIKLEKDRFAFGTGFLVNDTGLIVTNCHVVDGARTLLVVQRQPTIIKVQVARVVSINGAKDLAFIQVEGSTGTPFTLNRAGATKGSDVYAVGFPGQADQEGETSAFLQALFSNNFHDIPISDQYDNFVRSSVKKGNVEDVRMRNWGHPTPQGKVLAIQHNASITHGNSGGPLIDNEDRVVGVNTSLDAEAWSKDAKGQILQTGNILRFSSSSTELISLLDSSHLPYNTQVANPSSVPTPLPTPTLAPTPTPIPALGAVPTPAATPVRKQRSADGTSSGKDLSGDGGPSEEKKSDHHPVAWIIGIVLAAVAAGGFTLFLIWRAGSRPPSPHGDRLGGHPPPPPRPPPLPVPPAVPPPGNRARWLLSGQDMQGHPYRLAFDAESFARHHGALLLGRGATQCALRIDHDSLSRVHAELRYRGSRLSVVDKNSANGTRINDRVLKSEQDEAGVQPGDKLHFGEVTMTLRVDHSA